MPRGDRSGSDRPRGDRPREEYIERRGDQLFIIRRTTGSGESGSGRRTNGSGSGRRTDERRSRIPAELEGSAQQRSEQRHIAGRDVNVVEVQPRSGAYERQLYRSEQRRVAGRDVNVVEVQPSYVPSEELRRRVTYADPEELRRSMTYVQPESSPRAQPDTGLNPEQQYEAAVRRWDEAGQPGGDERLHAYGGKPWDWGLTLIMVGVQLI